MKKLVTLSVGAVFALCISGAAQATTTTFDFTTGGYERGYDLSFSQDGFDLNVSAAFYNTPGSVGETVTQGSSLRVTKQNTYGLYVYAYRYDDHRVDGYYNELVKFDFNGKTVTIDEITFGSVANPSVYDLYGTDDDGLKYAGSNPVVSPDALGVETSFFAVGASDNYSAFKITSLTVSDLIVDEVSPVPLPAGGLLLLSALGGFGFWRRKKAA